MSEDLHFYEASLPEQIRATTIELFDLQERLVDTLIQPGDREAAWRYHDLQEEIEDISPEAAADARLMRERRDKEALERAARQLYGVSAQELPSEKQAALFRYWRMFEEPVADNPEEVVRLAQAQEDLEIEIQTRLRPIHAFGRTFNFAQVDLVNGFVVSSDEEEITDGIRIRMGAADHLDEVRYQTRSLRRQPLSEFADAEALQAFAEEVHERMLEVKTYLLGRLGSQQPGLNGS